MTKQTTPAPPSVHLTREDLTLLGNFCMNDLPLVVEVTDESVRLLPYQNFTRSMTTTAIIIAGGFVGFWFFFNYLLGEEFHWGLQVSLLLLGVFTVGGVVLGFYWRQRYLLERSPLIEIDQATSQVSILAGSQTFALEEIVCLVAFSGKGSSDESACSELHLIVERDGKRQGHLIITSISSAAWLEFGKVLKPLAKACDLPVVITEAQGSGKQDFVLTPLPGKSL